jgi:hypothetical protein
MSSEHFGQLAWQFKRVSGSAKKLEAVLGTYEKARQRRDHAEDTLRAVERDVSGRVVPVDATPLAGIETLLALAHERAGKASLAARAAQADVEAAAQDVSDCRDRLTRALSSERNPIVEELAAAPLNKAADAAEVA